MSDPYAHEVVRKLCLQLSSMTGYDGVSDNALDVLSDVMQSFIKQNAICARNYAENSGRTEINSKDVMLSLDDMGNSVQQLITFENETEEVPFGASVPKFPIQPIPESYKSFKQQQMKSPGSIPDYLPIFPAEHTYRETALFVQKSQDPKSKLKKIHESKKTTEDVLIKFGTKDKREDPYLSTLFEDFEGQQDFEGKSKMTKRERKMASNWTELILGRVQKSEEGADPTTRLLPSNALSCVPNTDSHHSSKKRRKESSTLKETDSIDKKPKSSTAPFSAMLKFNLNPVQLPPSPRVKTEEGSLVAGNEERSIETDDYDIFGNPGGLTLEDLDSSEVVEDSSAQNRTPSLDIQPLETGSLKEENPQETDAPVTKP